MSKEKRIGSLHNTSQHSTTRIHNQKQTQIHYKSSIDSESIKGVLENTTWSTKIHSKQNQKK